jgi:hypothetical protein
MKTTSVPTCPNCGKDGKIKEVELHPSAVFKPLPEGWSEQSRLYQCECGWESTGNRKSAAPEVYSRA